MKVNITELDVDVLPSATQNRTADVGVSVGAGQRVDQSVSRQSARQRSSRQLAKRYADSFAFCSKHRGTVDRVTFWGVGDGDSWLNNWPVRGRTNYPLLFDRSDQPKPGVRRGPPQRPPHACEQGAIGISPPIARRLVSSRRRPMRDAFGPVLKQSLSDKLAHRIRGMIQKGDYKQGDRLPPIMEMARRFGVGHPTIREALKKLETMGVVEIRHGSGVYVSRSEEVLVLASPDYSGTVTKKLLLDLIRVRDAARDAVGRGRDARMQRSRISSRCAGCSRPPARTSSNDDVLNEGNMGFHRQIARASGNTVLAQMLDVLHDLFTDEQRLILGIFGSRERDHQEHLEILEALELRDEKPSRSRADAEAPARRAGGGASLESGGSPGRRDAARLGSVLPVFSAGSWSWACGGGSPDVSSTGSDTILRRSSQRTRRHFASTHHA